MNDTPGFWLSYLPCLIIGIQFESSGGDFTEAFTAAQRDSERDQLMLAAKFVTAICHAAVNLADVKRLVGFPQNDGRCLGNAEVIKSNVA